MISQPLLLVGVAVVAAWIYNLISDPLRSVPGPLLSRFTRFWELAQVRKSRFEATNEQLHQKYGPIVRLSPGRYSINDASAVRTLYGHGTNFSKSKFYTPFGSYLPSESDLFNERDPHHHGQMRRQVASLYSMTSLLSYEKFVDHVNAVLCDKLRMMAKSGETFDVMQWMQFYAFDVIGEITVGQPYGMLENGRDTDGILKGIHDSSVYGSRVGLFGEIHVILGSIATAMKAEIPFHVIKTYIDKNIAMRESGELPSDRDDFLSKLMQMKASGKIDHHTVFTTMGANIVAGSDTTAISLSSLLRFLALNPKALTSLRAEMDEFQRAGKLSHPVTFREASDMPYLQACIKEAIRLHPATGQPLPRVVPAGGAQIAGRFFPAGNVVGINPWVLHRNRDVFGDDAAEFRPERWLVSAEQTSRLEASFLSFGSGARTCLGKNISQLEMCKVIPQIVRDFDLVLEENTGYHTDSVWFVKPKFHMRVRMRR